MCPVRAGATKGVMTATPIDLPIGFRGGAGPLRVLALHGFTGTGRDFEGVAHSWPGASLIAPDGSQ